MFCILELRHSTHVSSTERNSSCLKTFKWKLSGFSTVIVKDLAVSQNEASLRLIKAVNGGSPFILDLGLIPACPICSKGSSRLGSVQFSIRTVERFCGLEAAVMLRHSLGLR